MDMSYYQNRRQVRTAFPGDKRKAFTMSYDDGNTCDGPLVELMRQCGVRGTFNINAGILKSGEGPIPESRLWRRMSLDEALQLYGNDMEIAIHGYAHPRWGEMPSPAAMQDILEDKRALERATGRIIRGGAYPYGGYNDDTVKLLQLADIAYCRTTVQTKSLKMQAGDFLRLKTTVHHANPAALPLAEQFVQDEMWDASNTNCVYFLWGHSYEFVKDDNWELIGKLLRTVGGREDIWYPTNLELIDYMNAAKELHYDVRQTRVSNPTGKELWLRVHHIGTTDYASVRVPAGQTVSLPD